MAATHRSIWERITDWFRARPEDPRPRQSAADRPDVPAVPFFGHDRGGDAGGDVGGY